MSTSSPAPWEKPGYGDITAAERTGDAITVTFANGDTVNVAPALLGAGPAPFTVEVDTEDPTHVRLRQGEIDREVDWSAIRVATDERFAAELRARDTEESRRVGARIRALREDRGLAQRDLAKLAGMAAPQLSKLERGESDMRLSTVRSLLRVMDATFADISGPQAREVSAATLVRLARGVDVPEKVLKLIAAQFDAARLPAALARAFGWSSGELAAGVLSPARLTTAVRFKASGEQPTGSPLLPLAHTVCELSAGGYDTPAAAVPADPLALRGELLSGGQGAVTLELLLGWAWAHGIMVVPMLGPGGFFAAAWTIQQRPAVLLKDARPLLAFWLFDLAHELGHIACGHLQKAGIVDVTSPSDPNIEDPQEREANTYALELLLPGHEQLIAEVRRRSERDPRNKFKWAVKDVAEQARLSPAVLGVAAAYELSDLARPQDRWGSATNLGKHDGSGRELAESYYRANVRLGDLGDIDAGLIRAVVLSS